MFLGVDGGGTKTAYCLLRADGHILAELEDASCYYLSIGFDAAERVLYDGVHKICRAAGIETADIEHAFFGLPAFGELSSALDRLRAMPAAALSHDRYHVGNDMVCGWAGSLGAADGINVVAGTGSIAYGERNGKGVRCGGWGELFGDEGSGYWIGIAGLNAFSRMSDGRLMRGPLHAKLKEYLDIRDDLDAIDVVLNHWNKDRRRIATLAPLVIDAAAEGGHEASRIIEHAVDALAELVATTAHHLGFESHETIAVSYSGGLFQADTFTARLATCLSRRGHSFDLREPLYPPAVGGALYAARLIGHPVHVGDN